MVQCFHFVDCTDQMREKTARILVQIITSSCLEVNLTHVVSRSNKLVVFEVWCSAHDSCTKWPKSVLLNGRLKRCAKYPWGSSGDVDVFTSGLENMTKIFDGSNPADQRLCNHTWSRAEVWCSCHQAANHWSLNLRLISGFAICLKPQRGLLLADNCPKWQHLPY